MASPALSATASSLRPSIFAQLQQQLEAFQSGGGELIPLHLGDTYLPPPPSALEAAAPEQDGDHCPELSVYTSPLGLRELKQQIIAHLAARGFDTLPERERNVHVGCGATHALFCAIRSVINPTDDVLVASPYWPLITGIIEAFGRDFTRYVRVCFTAAPADALREGIARFGQVLEKLG